MASIQKKGAGWYCTFYHENRRHTFTIGRVSDLEAETVNARVDYILMRLKQGLLELPAGTSIADFVRHDGKVPAAKVDPPPSTQLQKFRDSYLETFGHGAIESNTLGTARIHLNHLADTLGEKFAMADLSTAQLQRHIDRRRKDVAGVTIKKEIDTVRAAWNWAQRSGYVRGEFPGKGLVFPKDKDELPFMTWAEVERRIASGGDPDELWECLYLTTPEMAELLAFVEKRKAPLWVYPMLLFAAHTGARRSEMIRAQAHDVDLAGGVVTIHEKKRVRGRLTTRRVPLSETLSATMREWLPGRTHLFGPGQRPLSVQATQKAFVRVLKGSKWSVLKGWHVARHSFVSACASRGVDQRLIQEWCGHMSPAVHRRYQHLYPSAQREALRSVFS